MKVFLKRNLGSLIVFFIWLAIAGANYSSGTFLSGWDNLHSEFNFSVNLKRALFASWQEYQGLGLLGGMGHASDLYRQVILWIFSLILPGNFIRYFFHFLMLLIGALGIYFLAKDFILEKYDEKIKKLGGLCAGIFYLFNLATLQTFYLAWEAFSAHFGFLPWLFWAVFNYQKNPSRKNLLLFVLINLLSVSQGYVATTFIVYLIALTIVLFFHLLSEKKDFKKILMVLFLTFCINAFWLLPNLYFVFKNVSVNTNAKINLMSTENNFLMNKKFGDLGNTTLLKGFWFDNLELQANGKTEPIMGEWVGHLQKPFIYCIGYLLFGLSLLGIIFAIKTKNKKALLFLPVFLLSFTFLANDTFGFSFLAKLLYRLPLFSQIFRFPFTKFSILTAFCMAVFYSVGFSFLFSILQNKKISKLLLSVFFIFLPIIFLFPVFQGNLFYIKERAEIPNEYFEVFDFFRTQDKNTRIANFPQTTYWGWTNYQWGKQLYSGSGFLWYGIQQPILDRAFDVWSRQDENYYWEISQALYSKNRQLFENVLEKYQINWLLLDESVINPPSSKAIFKDELEEMFSKSGKIVLAQTFGKIKIYRVNLQTPVKDFVYLAENLPVVNAYQWGNVDVAYGELENYISAELDAIRYTLNAYYPFRSLFTGRKTEELDIEIEDLGNKIVFKKKLPEGLKNYLIELPKDYDGKELVEIEPVTYDTKYFIPTIDSDGKTISVSFPKIKGLLSTEINPSSQNIEAKNCNQFASGEVRNEKEKVLKLFAIDANNCSANFYLPNLSHKYSYLISTEAKNISGKPLLFWLENLTNRKADMELYLQTAYGKQQIANSYQLSAISRLIQPPMAQDGLGYTLHFDNISIGRQKTVNELGKIEVNLIPYRFLTELRLTADDSQLTANSKKQSAISDKLLAVNHSNPSLYEIKIERLVGDNTTLVLSQAFHSGWLAFDLDKKKEIKDHVLVNNWANGWQLPANSSQLKANSIILVFWPQYLEYLGFGFYLIILLFWLRAKSRK